MKLEKSGVKLKDGAAGIFEKYCDGVGLLPAACEFKMFRAGKTYCNHVKYVWREREDVLAPMRMNVHWEKQKTKK